MKHLKNFKKDIILYILIICLLILSTTLFVSLRVTSISLEHNYDQFSRDQLKNDFIIIPDYNKLDQLIESVSFYEFEKYQETYIGTPYALDYDNIKNMQNNQYLTPEAAIFIQDHINDAFIDRIKASTKPSLVIYNPIKLLFYEKLNPELSDYYKNRIAETQAKFYTNLLFLLTLNETNYLKFIEFTLDNRLLAKDEQDIYLKSTYASRFDLTIEKKVVNKVSNYLNNKEVHYYLTTMQKTFNQPYVVKSLDQKETLSLLKHEIAIYQEFADSNNLKLGDHILINDEAFLIKAFIYTPDTTYPILSSNQFYYDLEKDTIVLMNEQDFQTFSNSNYHSIVYTAKFNQLSPTLNSSYENLKNQFKTENIRLLPQIGFSDQVIQTNITNFNLLSYVLSLSVLIISILFMSIVLIRKLNQEQKQIGTLKALGYYKREIMYPYIIQYFILVSISTAFGFILGLYLSRFISNYLYTIFLIPYQNLHVNLATVNLMLLPIVLTTLVNVIILHIKLSKKSVSLLNQTDTIYQKVAKYPLQTKLTFFIFLFTIILTLTSFLLTNKIELIYLISIFFISYLCYHFFIRKNQFTDNIAKKTSNRNIKKIISFNLTIMMTALLLLFIFSAKSVYQDIYLAVNSNYTYKTYVKYPNFLNLTEKDLDECIDIQCEGITSYTFDILKINQQPINDSIHFYGYKENSETMLSLVKTELLTRNHVIITKPLAQKYHLKINDSITVLTHKKSDTLSQTSVPCQFNQQETCITEIVKIVHIADDFTSMAIYGNIVLLNEWNFGDNNHQNHINAIYTNAPLPSGLTLSNNILYSYQVSDLLNQLNHLLFTIILISNYAFVLISLTSIIIMLLITELSIKENNQQIALLKALGYKNNEISKMLLSQYNPYLFLMFFFALPITYTASHLLFNYIGIRMNKTLPVYIHYQDVLLSLILLFLIYIIASYLSLLRIKNVTLASLLK